MPRTKLSIILDIDQTLVQSLLTSKIPEQVMKYYTSVLEHTTISMMGQSITVFARPYLQAFLDFVFENFTVGVLTHSHMAYAQQVVDAFVLRKDKPERKLAFFLDNAYVELQGRAMGGLKNLQYLFNDPDVKLLTDGKFRECNTFIVDDNEQVYKTNLGNCVWLPKFLLAKMNSLTEVTLQGKSLYTFVESNVNDHVLSDLIHILSNFLRSHWEQVTSVCTLEDGPLFHRLKLGKNLRPQVMQFWNQRIHQNNHYG